jgi:hypothetical protein
LHCYLFALLLFLGTTLPGHVALCALFMLLCVPSRCSRSKYEFPEICTNGNYEHK